MTGTRPEGTPRSPDITEAEFFERACEVGFDLLAESFADKIATNPTEVRECVRTALELAREGALRLQDYEAALVVLTRHGTGDELHDGRLAWARLIESFFKRLAVLAGATTMLGLTLDGILTRWKLQESAGAGPQNQEQWMAEHRRLASLLDEQPTRADPETLRKRLADRARRVRNRGAHHAAMFPRATLREHWEIIEAVLTTMTAAVMSHAEKIRRGRLHERMLGPVRDNARGRALAAPWEKPSIAPAHISVDGEVTKTGIRIDWHDAVSGGGLHLVVADRGFGKTSLAIEYLGRLTDSYTHQSPCPVYLDFADAANGLVDPTNTGMLRHTSTLVLSLLQQWDPLSRNIPALKAELGGGDHSLIVDGLESLSPDELEHVLHALEQFMLDYPKTNAVIMLPMMNDWSCLGNLRRDAKSVFLLGPHQNNRIAKLIEEKAGMSREAIIVHLEGHNDVATLLSTPLFAYLMASLKAPSSPGIPASAERLLDTLIEDQLGDASMWRHLAPRPRSSAALLARVALHAVATALGESEHPGIQQAEAEKALEAAMDRLHETAALSRERKDEISEEVAWIGGLLKGLMTTRLLRTGPHGIYFSHPALENHCYREEFGSSAASRWKSLADRAEAWQRLKHAFARTRAVEA